MAGSSLIDLNSHKNREALIAVFPNLEDDVNFEILSQATPVYNCIAWAMQLDDRWVDPCDRPGHWWPKNVEKTSSPSALIHAFEAMGFTLCDNHNLEEGFDKVVLYKKEDADQWTHAARIVSEDVEYSKFGEGWDGMHSTNVLCETGKGFAGLSYGIPYAYMKRDKLHVVQVEKMHGKIQVNIDLLQQLIKSIK